MKEIPREQVLLTLIVNQIMSNPLAEESASSRLKQVALMTVIYASVSGEDLLSLSDLVRITGLTRGGIIETIEPLVRRGLLIETMGRNSMGRGTARYFEIASSVKTTIATVLGAPMGVESEEKR